MTTLVGSEARRCPIEGKVDQAISARPIHRIPSRGRVVRLKSDCVHLSGPLEVSSRYIDRNERSLWMSVVFNWTALDFLWLRLEHCISGVVELVLLLFHVRFLMEVRRLKWSLEDVDKYITAVWFSMLHDIHESLHEEWNLFLFQRTITNWQDNFIVCIYFTWVDLLDHWMQQAMLMPHVSRNIWEHTLWLSWYKKQGRGYAHFLFSQK